MNLFLVACLTYLVSEWVQRPFVIVCICTLVFGALQLHICNEVLSLGGEEGGTTIKDNDFVGQVAKASMAAEKMRQKVVVSR